jgi:O-antigen ligase
MLNQARLYFLIFALAGFGLVSFVPDITGVDVRIVTISYRALIFLISALLILFALANLKGKLLVKFTSLLSILLITAYLFRLSGDAQFNFGRSLSEIMIIAIGVSFIPAIALSTLKNNKIILKASNILIVCFVLIAFLAVFNGLIKGYDYRLSGNSVLNPITLGHFAASGIILITIKWLTLRGVRVSYMDKMWLMSSLLILFTALFMAGSRGPVLALFLTLGYYLSSRFIHILRKKLFGVIAILTLIIIVVNSFEQVFTLFSNRMIIDIGDGQEGGEARVLLWINGVKIFLQYPFFGNQTTTLMGYPHNIMIEILMSTGVVGGIAFLMIIAHAIKKVHLLNKSHSMLIWPGLLFFQHLTGSLLSGTLYSSNDLWYSLALLLAVNLNHLPIIFENRKKTNEC